MFIQNDFASKFIDSNNDNLVKIRIESLPTHGKLVLNGVDVTIGLEILSNDLEKLEFILIRIMQEISPSAGLHPTVWIILYHLLMFITIAPLTVFIPEGFHLTGMG